MKPFPSRGKHSFKRFLFGSFLFLLFGNPGVTTSETVTDDLLEGLRIIPARIQWLSSEAEVISTPRMTHANNYERSVSVPRIAAIKVKNVPYIYMSFRVDEYQAGAVLRLARIPAEHFSKEGRITPLDRWEWIPAERFRISDARARLSNPSLVAIKGMLFLNFKRMARKIPAPAGAVLFDPENARIVWERDLPELEGYAGPSDSALTSLARVTSSPPNIDGDYFDSTQGNVVLTYACRQTDSAACKSPAGYRNGFYLQSVHLHEDGIRLGPPIRLFSSEVPFTVRPNESRARYPLWHKQNLAVSNLGNDTLLFSVCYNVTADHSNRPVDRDYPCCCSFFELPSLSLVLKRSEHTAFLDLKALMPKENTWRPNIRADSPWDQGAIWSQSVYLDPYSDNTVFSMYEGWGANYMQPEKTRNAFYPGSRDRFVWKKQPAAQKSCNDVCKDWKFNGGACLSASAIGPESNWHGTEIPHDQSLADYIRHSDDAIIGALYVCSDLGTRETNSDIKLATVNVPDSAQGETIASLARKVCEREASGYVRVEINAPMTEEQGYTVSPDRKVAPNETLHLACSTRYSSDSFRIVTVSDLETSCDMACDSLGAGSGIGYRPYHSEIMAKNGDNSSFWLDKGGVDPEFVLSLLRKLDFPGAKQQTVPTEMGLTCVCGPGRNLGATMAVRVGRLIE